MSYLVFGIDICDAPAGFLSRLLRDAHAFQLLDWIVQTPAFDRLFSGWGAVAKGVKPVHALQTTCQPADALKNRLSLAIFVEMEGYEVEVATAKADRGRLVRGGRGRAKGAEVYHGIGDPCLLERWRWGRGRL
jgi:hypothetical protein